MVKTYAAAAAVCAACIALAGCGNDPGAMSADFARLRESADSWPIWEYCCIDNKDTDILIETVYDGERYYSRCDMADGDDSYTIWHVDDGYYSPEGAVEKASINPKIYNGLAAVNIDGYKAQLTNIMNNSAAKYEYVDMLIKGDYVVIISAEDAQNKYNISVSSDAGGVLRILINDNDDEDKWTIISKPPDKGTPWQEYIDWEGGGNG